MPAAKPTKVYNIPGRFLPGYRMEDHEVESAEAANELVKTGLYALSAKDANAAAYTGVKTTEASDDNVKRPRYPRTVGAGFDALIIEAPADEPPDALIIEAPADEPPAEPEQQSPAAADAASEE